MIDGGSWWILMPDSEPRWLMHMVSRRYQMIIIKEKVQICGGSWGIRREVAWRLFVTWVVRGHKGRWRTETEIGNVVKVVKQMVHVQICLGGRAVVGGLTITVVVAEGPRVWARVVQMSKCGTASATVLTVLTLRLLATDRQSEEPHWLAENKIHRNSSLFYASFWSWMRRLTPLSYLADTFSVTVSSWLAKLSVTGVTG